MTLLFLGNYGNHNIGDDAILLLLSNYYRREHSEETQEVVVSHSPSYVRTLDEKLSAVPASPFAVLAAVFRADKVVIGGGGIFCRAMGRRAKLIAPVGVFCALLGKEVRIESLGVYSDTPLLQKVFLRVLCRVALEIRVRDGTSAIVLQRLTKRPVINVGDPVWHMPSLGAEEGAGELEKLGVPLEARILVVFCLRQLLCATLNRQFVSVIKAVIEKVATHPGVEIVCLPFSNEEEHDLERDGDFMAELCEQVGQATCIRQHLHPFVAEAIIKKADLLVAMRFHAILLGVKSAVPVFAIPYADKCRELIEEFEIPSVEPEAISFEFVYTQIMKALLLDSI